MGGGDFNLFSEGNKIPLPLAENLSGDVLIYIRVWIVTRGLHQM